MYCTVAGAPIVVSDHMTNHRFAFPFSFFLSFSLSLSLSLQTKHGTVHTDEVLRSNSPKSIYGTTRSWLYETSNHPSESDLSRLPSSNGFLQVWNDKTPEYARDMKELVDSLPWKEEFARIVGDNGSAKVDSRRGNTQESFAYAGGRSHQARTRQNVLENYGAAIPSVRSGTALPTAHRAISICSKIVVKAGAVWTNQHFLHNHPDVAKRLRTFCTRIREDCFVETIAVIFMPLDGEASVYEHTDPQNCGECTQVIIIQRVIVDSHGK